MNNIEKQKQDFLSFFIGVCPVIPLLGKFVWVPITSYQRTSYFVHDGLVSISASPVIPESYPVILGFLYDIHIHIIFKYHPEQRVYPLRLIDSLAVVVGLFPRGTFEGSWSSMELFLLCLPDSVFLDHFLSWSERLYQTSDSLCEQGGLENISHL